LPPHQSELNEAARKERYSGKTWELKGSLYRRLKSRLDKAQATVATAHAIARVVYRMLKYQVEYETISVEEYEQKYKEQQIKYMKKTCTEPVEVKPGSSAFNSCLPECNRLG